MGEIVLLIPLAILWTLMRREIRAWTTPRPGAEDLFPGENLILATDASLRIDDGDSLYGAVFLTDLRIVWTPFEGGGWAWHRTANAMHPDAIAITLGEIRRARTRWDFVFDSFLIVETPEATFTFRDDARSFKKWLNYIAESAPNLLKANEQLIRIPTSKFFRPELVERGRYATHGLTLFFAALLVAKVVRNWETIPVSAPVLLTLILGCSVGSMYFLWRSERVEI